MLGVDLVARILAARKRFCQRTHLLRAEHESVLARLHVRTAGSKWQACGLKIIPSFRPSLSSHVFIIASASSFLSPPEKSFVGSGLPEASLGAICAKATLAQVSPIFEYPVRMAGSPETIPSK